MFESKKKFVGNELVRGFERYCTTYGWPLFLPAHATDSTARKSLSYLLTAQGRNFNLDCQSRL